MRWTGEQARAITGDRHTLLMANAGTGKTTTIVGKILWLLGLPAGEDPAGRPLPSCPRPCTLREIAAITFTEKAAIDLKRKLREALEDSDAGKRLLWQLEEASIGTIHAFCGRLLREQALRLGIDPGFRVLDENEALAAQRECIHDLLLERLDAGDERVELLLETSTMSGARRAEGLVEKVRCALRELRWHPDRRQEWLASSARARRRADDGQASAEAARLTDALLQLASEALERWREHLQRENARDFDALVLDVHARLCSERGAAARAGIRRRLRVLIIDEFQDTDSAQWEIALAIGQGKGAPQLFLVGDPKQSIYRFRGADVSVWNAAVRWVRAHGQLRELTRNFRCAPPIIEFANAAAGHAIAETAARLQKEGSDSVVPYVHLQVGVEGAPAAPIDWLVPAEGKNAQQQRDSQGRLIARRIRRLVQAGTPVRDPDRGELRPCHLGDIAVLYRGRTGLEAIEGALADAEIPYWLATTPRLADRVEVRDLLNVLRLLDCPSDDLLALGFLRSPFVALRDEVIAAIRLRHPRAPLLQAARQALGEPWPPAPEPLERLEALEREALRAALDALAELRALAGRLAPHELIEELLERTGYLDHLLLADHAEDRIANVHSLIRFCEGYRDLDPATFLEVWDRWSEEDLGIPQAPLYSRHDRVVTLSTVHTAKGLEWPIVFFVDLSRKKRDGESGLLGDRVRGPVVVRRKDDRGPVEKEVAERDRAEAEAEEARLLYVALTRARDRLVVVPSSTNKAQYGEWLEAGKSALEKSADERKIRRLHDTAEAPGEEDRTAEPPALQPPAGAAEARALQQPVPGLAARRRRRERLLWLLERVHELVWLPPPAAVAPLPSPPPRRLVSATELMLRARDADAWRRRFVHGVEAPWEFARRGRDAEGLSPLVRGTLIHKVLERHREDAELAALLEEALGGIDDPELSATLAQDDTWREELAREIDRVVSSPEWRSYVEGEHYRELRFLHLRGAAEWRQGAFDLYRPDRPVARLIDFKTHEIGPQEAARVAAEYTIQAYVYRQAAEIRGPVSVALHFTHANTVVEMTESGRDEPPSPAGGGSQRELF